jgi:hypothetical protein
MKTPVSKSPKLKARLYGYAPLSPHNEVYLSANIFWKLGISQPAWVVLDSPESE